MSDKRFHGVVGWFIGCAWIGSIVFSAVLGTLVLVAAFLGVRWLWLNT